MDAEMDARDWLDLTDTESRIVTLTYLTVDHATKRPQRLGLGRAYVVDAEHRIAIMLTAFGDPKETGICGGEVVRYGRPYPEANEFVIESTAFYGNREPEQRPRLPMKT